MEIQIEVEMCEPLNKICALADLFDAAGCDDITLDCCGRLGKRQARSSGSGKP
jgi:hypothetical protein